MTQARECLFLCQFFYPEYVSSATLPFDTAQKLVKAGYQVSVLCGYPKEYNLQSGVPENEELEGIQIKRLRYLQLKRTGFLGRVLNYASFLLNVFLHIPYMKKFKIIFVYSNPPQLPLAALIAKKIYGCQFVFISYDVYPEIGIRTGKIAPRGFISCLMYWINKKVVKNADKIVALSQDMKQFYIKKRKVDENKIVVIPNWYEDINVSNKPVGENKLLSDISEGSFVVSYLGNLGVCQEMETLLEAIRQLKTDKKIFFLFAGHGNKMEKLKQAVENERLQQVKIFGFLQEEDYLQVLNRTDVCMVTLEKDLKGLCSPSKVCGYLMAKKPIIAILDKKMELAKDIVGFGCGYVIPHGDTDMLKSKIVDLKEQQGLKEELSLKSRELYESKYEKEICLDKYLRLVEMGMRKSV